MPLAVRPLPAQRQAEFVTQHSGSFLQTPAWAGVKPGWRPLGLGWFDGERLVATALVLLRAAPVVGRWMAYLPEGPVWDRATVGLDDVLPPLVGVLREQKAFTVRVGPQVVVRRWSAATIKAAQAGGGARRLGDVPPDVTEEAGMAARGVLARLGWAQQASSGGFGDMQPRYVFQLPLTGRSEEDLLAGLNQLWRRNIRRAQRDGVAVELGGRADLAAFHALYLETAGRDAFTPRPAGYFTGMWDALRAEDPDRLRLYLGRREDDLLAATLWVRVGRHVWYSYGASSTHGREHRASNAVQWAMLRDAHAAGAAVYDMRGISDTLDPGDHLAGLLQFKLGTGGEAVEYVGEWDLPLSALLHKAFHAVLARR